VSPFIDPPANVENFFANVVGANVHLIWKPVPDADLSHYKIRYSSLTSGATYSNAVDVVTKIARPANTAVVPARTGTYFIRAYDKLNNASLTPTSVVVFTEVSEVENLNVVETLQEDPTFTGAKTDVVLATVDGVPALILDSATAFDSATGNFDDALGLFDFGGGVKALGIYEFSNYVDLGDKYLSRVSVDLSVSRVDYVNTFDSASGNFDSRESLFDGDPDAFDTTSVRTQVSYTDDDPAGTPTWSAWQDFFVADISARAIRFRALLISEDDTATPAITAMTALVDMPDRVESQSDLAFTGSINVTYPYPFKATPAIGVSLANLQNGQRYAITSKTPQGFTLTVYNSGGGVATNSVTLDYVAKGYGKGL
jgi:hypothetical protein